jgi:putative DNA primase/helicase
MCLQSGLAKPPEVQAANDQWRSESDQLARFIDECCTTAPPFSVSSSGLYANYKSWAESGTEAPMTAAEFAVKLAGKGFEKKHKNTGDRYFGIRLRDDAATEER